MSILTFLCFTCLIYFSLADPIPPASVGATQDPSTDMKSQVDAMTAAIDEFVKKSVTLLPAYTDLEKNNQDYVQQILNDAVTAYLNFVKFLIAQEVATDPKTDNAEAYDNDVLFIFNSQDSGSYLTGNSDQPAGKGNQ